jgi:hypothetical protein
MCAAPSGGHLQNALSTRGRHVTVPAHAKLLKLGGVNFLRLQAFRTAAHYERDLGAFFERAVSAGFNG